MMRKKKLKTAQVQNAQIGIPLSHCESHIECSWFLNRLLLHGCFIRPSYSGYGYTKERPYLRFVCQSWRQNTGHAADFTSKLTSHIFSTVVTAWF